MKKTYTFYSDPGHGWLKVDLKDLINLGILDQISNFSYARKGKKSISVYLEEDMDAGIFLKAISSLGISPKFNEKNCRHKSSKIRKYQSLYSILKS